MVKGGPLLDCRLVVQRLERTFNTHHGKGLLHSYICWAKVSTLCGMCWVGSFTKTAQAELESG
jgi:hypothetical protein